MIVKTCKTHGGLTTEQIYERTGNRKSCRECVKQKNAIKYQQHKEERLEKAAQYRETHREKLAEWARNNRKNNPERYKYHYHHNGGRGISRGVYNKLTSYGLTKEQYDLMLEAQNNCCNICEQQFTGRISIDHCHSSLVIRGLLCSNCNAALGKFKDSPALIQNAIAYLIKHSEAA